MAQTHAWKVYDRDELILDVSDKPGPIMSTAALPPGVSPKKHPFLSATAHSASHESKLRDLLEASKSVPDFLKHLADAGYSVKPLP